MVEKEGQLDQSKDAQGVPAALSSEVVTNPQNLWNNFYFSTEIYIGYFEQKSHCCVAKIKNRVKNNDLMYSLKVGKWR